MEEELKSALNWIESEKNRALDYLQTWSAINSWTENQTGLAMMADAVHPLFAKLADTHNKISLSPWKRTNLQGEPYETPLGNVLFFSKNKTAGKKILFGGHMDTVFPPSSPFQTPSLVADKLIGPGVADMKGGLLVLWLALSAFEKFAPKNNLGWEVIISPDEEIGSVGSHTIWQEKAKNADIGLLFEPSYQDGALVSARKGSFNATVHVTGKSAHAGRDFALGRSAVHALSHFIVLSLLKTKHYPDVTLNVGVIQGGSVVNVVAEHAYARLNVRSQAALPLEKLREDLFAIAREVSHIQEVKIDLQIDTSSQPKPFTGKTLELYNALQATANDLGQNLTARASGGVCDGNLLATAGLANIDTLGVIGGNLHTDQEFMQIDSLHKRALLVTAFLFRYANNDFKELAHSNKGATHAA